MYFETIASNVSDNYFYLLADDDGRAGLVDPVDASAAVERVRAEGFDLQWVINTHFHHDHVGGDADVLDAFEGARLVGAAGDARRIEDGSGCELDRTISGGDTLNIGSLELRVFDTPGHTPGHISLLIDDHLLCGDTVFVGGAGNCKFGGDPGTLFQTFRDVLSDFDDDVNIYPGHDYSVRNIEFVLSIEPHNEPAKKMLHRAREADGLFVTTLGAERSYNPFFRYDDPALKERLRESEGDLWEIERKRSESDDEAVFRSVRELRNRW